MKLSIITINYNNKVGLQRTFSSVFCQTNKEMEYIVIDGGSVDGSTELIKENQDKISYWVSESDNGIYNAMNKGIRVANGEYLLFLNSGDNLYSENVLQECLSELTGEDVISGNLEIKDENNLQSYWASPEKVGFSQFILQTICHPCTFIRKDAFEKYGFYDEHLRIVSDWKWFLLAFCKYNLTYKKLDFLISTFYLDGISSAVDNTELISKERNFTLNEYFPTIYPQYQELFDYKEKYSRILQNSRWIRLGKKIGLLNDLD
ncbi:MAG: glycosyltransferase family 2 protein [Dysgonamonadaceae bacterium]